MSSVPRGVVVWYFSLAISMFEMSTMASTLLLSACILVTMVAGIQGRSNGAILPHGEGDMLLPGMDIKISQFLELPPETKARLAQDLKASGKINEGLGLKKRGSVWDNWTECPGCNVTCGRGWAKCNQYYCTAECWCEKGNPKSDCFPQNSYTEGEEDSNNEDI